MDKRQIAIAVIGMVGVLGVSDFVANVRTITSPTIIVEIGNELGGISLEQEFARLAVLIVLTLTISVLCFAAAWGFYRNLVLKIAYRWAAVALLLNGLFHLVTALTLPTPIYVWILSAANGVLALLVFFVGKWASDGSRRR
jgi:hypothetical protein